MRTLKRTLCLVLALVMVLGLCVTSVSAVDATKFKDLNQSKHQEAIKVLAALDVVQGENGQLKLDRTLSRAEMASLIYQLIGKDSKFVPTTTFTDVAEGKWYYTPIAFCENRGILSGYGDGRVGPEDLLTGYELGSMLLGVVGYDRKYEIAKMQENNKGADWKFVTYTYVLDRGLDKGLSVDYPWDQPISRDDAFQMVFNTLKATMVEYDSNGSFTLPDGTSWSNRGSAKDIARNETGESSLNNYAGTEANAPGYGTQQVCERYWSKLTMSDAEGYDRDDFMRPGHTWLYNNADIAFVADDAYAVYNGTFTKTNYDALVKRAGNVDDNVIVYYNGVNDEDHGNEKFVPYANNEPADPVVDGKAVTGYEIEVYTHKHTADCVVEGEGDTCGIKYEINVREAYIAQIGEITAATKSSKATIEVAGAMYDGSAVQVIDITVSEDAKAYPALAAHEEEDYVAVYFKGGALEAANNEDDDAEDYVLEVAELDNIVEDAKITLVEETGYMFTTHVTADGVRYGMNNQAIVIRPAGTPVYNYPILGAATLYTYNGNILLIDQEREEEIPNVGYAYVYDVKKVDKSTDATDNKWESEGGEGDDATTAYTYLARLLLTNGDTTDEGVTVIKVGSNELTGGSDVDDAEYGYMTGMLGKLVYYVITDDGYELTPFDGTTADKGTGLEIVNKRSEGLVPEDDDESTSVAFDSKTVFMIVETDETADPSKFLITKDVTDIYKISNITEDSDNVIVTAVTPIAANGDSGELVADSSDDPLVASVVLIRYEGQRTLTDSVYFIVDNDEAPVMYTYAEDGVTQVWYKELNAVVDGKVQTVKVATRYGGSTPDGYSTASAMFAAGNGTILTDEVRLDKGIIVNVGSAPTLTIDVDAVGPYKNDRIDITSDDTTVNYLVSNALNAVFEYSVENGSIKSIDPEKNITSKTATDFTGGYAVIDSGVVNTVYYLFLTKDAAD